MTGLELANLISQIKPEIKIVLMTAYDILPQEIASALPIVKWQDVLHKPFRLVEVCNAVKKQLQVT